MKEGTVTVQAKRALYSPDYIPFEKSCEYLREPCHFQSFAGYIERLVREKPVDLGGRPLPDYLAGAVLDLCPVSEDERDEVRKFFRRAFKTNKKGEYTNLILDVPRQYALKLCFVFRLNADESRTFLHKACVTPGFNVRSAFESACLYCIRSGKTYQTAVDLLRQYESAPDGPCPENEIAGTQSLYSAITETDWKSSEDFLNSFLIPNRPNYKQYSLTTFKTYSELRLSLCHQILELRAEQHPSVTGDKLFIRLKDALAELEKKEPGLGLRSEGLSDWRDVPRVMEFIREGLERLYPDEAEKHYDGFIHKGVSNTRLLNEMLDYRTNFPTGEQAAQIKRELEEKWRKRQQKKAQKNGTDGEEKLREASDSQISWRSNSDSSLRQIMYCFPQPKYLNYYEKHPKETPTAKIRKIIILLCFLDEFFDLFYCGDSVGLTDQPAQPIEQFESWVEHEFPDSQNELARFIFSEEQSDAFSIDLCRLVISNVKKAKNRRAGETDKRTYRQWQYERFYNRLQDMLLECSLPELYPANPFDWLILNSARVLIRLDQTYDDPIGYFNSVIESSFSGENFIRDDIPADLP